MYLAAYPYRTIWQLQCAQTRPTLMIPFRKLSCFILDLLKLYTLRSIMKNTTKISKKALELFPELCTEDEINIRIKSTVDNR